ncbi:MAG: hypothetical protein J6J86_02940 [Lachnospiraceae bacterium]|nr:hypothetical protein [Lachnospiraceae bacterium]
MKEHKAHSRRKYKFTDKSQSIGGIFSTVLAVAAILLFVVAVWMSYRKKGNAGIEIGLMGVLSLFLSGIGLWVGVKSFQEEEIFFLFSWVGTILSAIMLVGMSFVFLVGL